MDGWTEPTSKAVDILDAGLLAPSLVPGLGALALGQEKARQNWRLRLSRELVAQDRARYRRREVGALEELKDRSQGPDLPLAVEKRPVSVPRLPLPQKAPHGRFQRRVVGCD